MKSKFVFWGIGVILFLIFISNLGRLIVSCSEPQHSDALVILMGELEDRGKFAADLYNKGYSSRIFLVTPSTYKEKFRIKYGMEVEDDIDVMIKLLESLGVKKRDITFFSEVSKNTIGEAKILLNTLSEMDSIKALTVITSSYHSSRAEAIFKRYALKNNIAIQINVPFNPFTEYNYKSWYFSEHDIETTYMEVSKWLVYIFYTRWII